MSSINELKNYRGSREDLEKLCLKFLDNTNYKLKTYIGMFNSLIIELSGMLAREFPNDQSLYTYSNIISDVSTTKPTELISLFIVNVYQNDNYRKYILAENDKFFLMDDHKNITGDNKNNIRLMFQFKNHWGRLDDDSKKYIKGAMKTLVEISSAYIEKKDDGNRVAEILKSI